MKSPRGTKQQHRLETVDMIQTKLRKCHFFKLVQDHIIISSSHNFIYKILCRLHSASEQWSIFILIYFTDRLLTLHFKPTCEYIYNLLVLVPLTLKLTIKYSYINLINIRILKEHDVVLGKTFYFEERSSLTGLFYPETNQIFKLSHC